MAMDRKWVAFFDEMQKLGISIAASPFRQTRAGRRPVRVETALRRDDDQNRFRPPEAAEEEIGAGLADKVAHARWLERGSAVMRKVAAMAGDLRRAGIGNVKQPPFPTEDSKQLANKNLNLSTRPGKFTNQTEPKHLRKPGPPISTVATTPNG